MVPRPVVLVLRALLAVGLVALTFAQLRALPAVYDEWVRDADPSAVPRWPALALAVLVLGCLQSLVVFVWRLLTRVSEDRIFSQESFRWVDAILGAIAAAWLLLVAGLAHALALGTGPVVPVALALLLVAGGVLGLLMVVMKALLRQAADLRADLDAVI